MIYLSLLCFIIFLVSTYKYVTVNETSFNMYKLRSEIYNCDMFFSLIFTIVFLAGHFIVI